MLMYVPLSAKRTLEFGCGTGSFSAEIKKRNGSDAWAVEINEESACAASKKLDQVICSDAANSIVQIPDDYFDCVIMLDILEHLHDPYQFLIQLKTKIRSDGLIVASIPNVRYYRHFIEYVFKGNWNYQDAGTLDKTHLRFFTYNSILKTLDQLGYEVLSIEGINASKNKKLRFYNFLCFGKLWDLKYLQYAVVAKPK